MAAPNIFYDRRCYPAFKAKEDPKHPLYGKTLEDAFRFQGGVKNLFIIQWDVSQADMPRKGKKAFFAFRSALEAYQWIQTVPVQYRSFYETTLGNRPQKPHFDIDCEINMSDLGVHTGQFEAYFNNLLFCVQETLKACEVTIKAEENLRVYDSSGPKDGGRFKLSRHLVVTGVQHNNNKEAAQFYAQVKQRLVDLVGPHIVEEVYKLDPMVYSSMQQFRIVGCAKSGSNRPKKLVPFAGTIPISRSPDAINTARQCGLSDDYADFIESLLNPIGYAEDRIFTHPLLSNVKSTYTPQVFDLLEDPLSLASRFLMSRKDIEAGYLIGDYSHEYHSVRLINKGNGTVCPSHHRVHRSNNAFIRITKSGACFFRCFADGDQETVLLGQAEVSSEDSPAIVEAEPLSEYELAEQKKMKIEFERSIVQEKILSGGDRLNGGHFNGLMLTNIYEKRYSPVTMPVEESSFLTYQNLRGWFAPPSVGDVQGMFIPRNGFNISYENECIDGPSPHELDPREVIDFTDPQSVTEQKMEFKKYQTYQRNVMDAFFRTANNLCSYLSKNHKVKVKHLLCKEGPEWVDQTSLAQRTMLTFVFNRQAPLVAGVDDPARYPLGYKWIADPNNKITYSVYQLMTGSHLRDQQFCPYTRARWIIKWGQCKTMINPVHLPNRIPFLPGDSIPLRHETDVNEFCGYGVLNTLQICKDHGYVLEKLRGNPLIEPFLLHIYYTFAASDMNAYREIMSWLAFSFAKNGARTNKMLNMFGPRSSAKSIFFQDIFLKIFGHAGGLGTLDDFTGDFNGPLIGKSYVAFDEATADAAMAWTPRKLKEGVKRVVTGSTIQGHLKYENKHDHVNYCNIVFCSNFPETCNWMEKEDMALKRSLSYVCHIIGYDSATNEYVTSSTEDFAVRYIAGTKTIAKSTQPPYLLLENYYHGNLRNYKHFIDLNAIEHFAAYLYAYAHTQGSGFIDYSTGVYNQKWGEVHDIILGPGGAIEREFAEDLVSEEGYRWLTVQKPLALDRAEYGEHNNFVTVDQLYAEYYAWFKLSRPSTRNIPCKKEFRASFNEALNISSKLHRYGRVGEDDNRVTFYGNTTKYTGYGIQQECFSPLKNEPEVVAPNDQFRVETPTEKRARLNRELAELDAQEMAQNKQ